MHCVRIERNRARKFHNQQRILFERLANFDAVVRRRNDRLRQESITREDLDWVIRHTTKLEWDCLWGLAIGESYQEIADRVSLKISQHCAPLFLVAAAVLLRLVIGRLSRHLRF